MIFFLCYLSFKNQRLDKSFTNSYSQVLSYKSRRVIRHNKNKEFIKEAINKIYFIFFILVLQLTLHILFTTDNVFYFFICFELSVIPVFAIMGFFGKRSLKFKAMNYLLYFTIFSAIPFIITSTIVYVATGSIHYSAFKFYFFNTGLESNTLILFFIGFFIPFAVKLSLFPFHT